jgi:hypothetical protein
MMRQHGSAVKVSGRPERGASANSGSFEAGGGGLGEGLSKVEPVPLGLGVYRLIHLRTVLAHPWSRAELVGTVLFCAAKRIMRARWTVERGAVCRRVIFSSSALSWGIEPAVCAAGSASVG